MDRKTSLTILIALFLASCAKAEIPLTPTSTPLPTASPIPTPTEIPTTPTAAGPKEGDVTTVTENGHDYIYTYTKLGETETGKALWEDVREVGTISLMDTPYINYLPFKIFIADSVDSKRNFVSFTHRDWIDPSEPITPLASTLMAELETRYFQDDPRKGTMTSKEEQKTLQVEMQGLGEGEHKQAYIDIIVANGTPEGELKRVKLSETTGIILTLLSEEDIVRLGGGDVLELHAQGDGRNYTYFVQVYDVDNKGNELARVAFRDPLSEIPENILRKVLFTIPGNFVDHKDQREQGFTNVAQIFAQYSAKLGVDGKPDVVINLLPAATPTPTP